MKNMWKKCSIMIKDVYQKWKQSRSGKGFVKVCVFFLCCNFCARAIYAYQLPRVQTGYVQSMTISHEVVAEGTIRQESEAAVNVLPGLRVAKVNVEQGQQVQEGDALLEMDMDALGEEIAEKEAEIEKLQLEIYAAQTNQQLVQNTLEKNRERAAQDYTSTVQEGESQVTDAAGDLLKAQEKLAAFDTLSAYQEKKLQQDSQLVSLKTASDLADKNKKDAQKNYEDIKEEIASLQKQLEEADDDAVKADIQKTLDEKNAEKDAAKEAADGYKDALESAEKEIEAYETTRKKQLEEEWGKEKEALQQTVDDQTKIYEKAIDDGKAEITEAGREVEDSNVTPDANNIIAVNQISLEQAQADLAKYKAIQEAQGVITSAYTGTVEEIKASVGSQMQGDAAMVIGCSGAWYEFAATVSKEDKKYIDVGDMASVSFDGGRILLENVEVLSVTASKTDDKQYDVTVRVPSEGLALNQTGSLKVVKHTTRYPTCVPLSALIAENSRYYCMILQSRDGFLGEELYLEKREVTIQDKNSQYAALTDGIVMEEEDIVTSSNKQMRDKMTVRMQEN